MGHRQRHWRIYLKEKCAVNSQGFQSSENCMGSRELPKQCGRIFAAG